MNRIEELTALLEQITPGEWEVKRADNGEIAGIVDGFGREVFSPDHDHWSGWKVSFHNPDDARFIAAAPEAVRDLLEVVQAAQDAVTPADHIKTPDAELYAVSWDRLEALRKALEAFK